MESCRFRADDQALFAGIAEFAAATGGGVSRSAREKHEGSTLGELLRRRRLRAGLTQVQLAQQAHIGVRTLRDIERGNVDRPRAGSLRKLSELLGLPDLDEGRDRAASPVTAEGVVCVRVLGPLSVRRGDVELPISSLVSQRVLQLLAFRAGEPVSVEDIAEVLWGLDRPRSWRNQIQVQVNRLRQLLEPQRGRREASRMLPLTAQGYRLSLADGILDVRQFQQLAGDAAAAVRDGDSDLAAELYERALRCWRGSTPTGTDSHESFESAVLALRRARVSATLSYADVVLRLGHAEKASDWLQTLVAQEPLHEGLHVRLMAVLAASGEQAAALRLYLDLRTRLTDELGVEPDAATQAEFRRILRQSHPLEQTSSASPQVGSPPVPKPNQLPMPSPYFVGRVETIATVMAALTSDEPGGPKVVVLHGMAGVGKTALAVEAGHRVRERYPDGQLFADLQGERDHPARPDQVLSAFLRAAGIPARDIPSGLNERAAQFRSHASGRRILVVLDDARSAEQVMSMLPSHGGSDVLITSRLPLPELPALHLPVGPLANGDALAVLTKCVPAGTAEREPEAANEIIEYCAGLPLALRIVSARLGPGLTLGDMAELLGDSAHRLGELRSGHLAVAASLESSVRRLSSNARIALQRLAALPSQTFPRWTVGVVLATHHREAIRVTAELSNAQLISASDQHYRQHQLVQLYLRDAAGDENERDRAVARVTAAWYGLATLAARRVTSRMLNIDRLPPELPPVNAEMDKKTERALLADPHSWFERSYPSLIDTIRHACAQGQARIAVGILHAVSPYFRIRFLIDQWRECLALVQDTVALANDIDAKAYGTESAVLFHLSLAEFDAAARFAQTGADLFEARGDTQGLAQMLYHLQYFKRRGGEVEEAVRINNQLVVSYAELGDRVGEAAARHALGVIHKDYLHDLPAAQEHLEAALELVSSAPEKREYSQVCYSVAWLYMCLGRTDDAERLFMTCLDASRARKDKIGIASVLTRLADLWTESDPERAGAALREALSVTHGIGAHDAQAQVHESLARLAERTGSPTGALEHLHRAEDLYRAMGSPRDAKNVADGLSRLYAAIQSGSDDPDAAAPANATISPRHH